MSGIPASGDHSPPTVFLSYASEDREVARRLGDALPAYGLEIWYDESELGGGDAWDQKIRKQIRDCDYFLAIVSAQTEARHEGYFRREWRLAVERTLDMADDHTFLLPVVIDKTDQARARVPEKFLAVQWLRVPGGEPTPALEALCRRLASGESVDKSASKGKARAVRTPSLAASPSYPEFPVEKPGQRMHFAFSVLGWALRGAWIAFRRLPGWVRVLAYIWLVVVLLSKGCTPHHKTADMTPIDSQKLKAIADRYHGSTDKDDLTSLAQIAREFGDAVDKGTERRPLLAIPFIAPAGDADGAKLADSTFAQVYGRISMAHPGYMSLNKDPLPSGDIGIAIDRARANHSTFLLYGTVVSESVLPALTIKIITVADGTVTWSKSYPEAGADPAKIAAEVTSQIGDLEED